MTFGLHCRSRWSLLGLLLLSASLSGYGCTRHHNPLPEEPEPPHGWQYDAKKAEHPVEVCVEIESRPAGAKVYYVLGYYPRHPWFARRNDLVGIEKGFDWPSGNYLGVTPFQAEIVDKGYTLVEFNFVMPDGTKYNQSYDHVPEKVLFTVTGNP